MKRLFAALFCALFIAAALITGNRIIISRCEHAEEHLTHAETTKDATDVESFVSYWENAEQLLSPFAQQDTLREIGSEVTRLDAVYGKSETEFADACAKLHRFFACLKEDNSLSFLSLF